MNFDFELWRVYYNRTMERGHFCHLNLCVNNKPYLGVRCFCLISEFYLNMLRDTFIFKSSYLYFPREVEIICSLLPRLNEKYFQSRDAV